MAGLHSAEPSHLPPANNDALTEMGIGAAIVGCPYATPTGMRIRTGRFTRTHYVIKDLFVFSC